MKLHVFNPEHDIALAANLTQFTAPHAGRQLRSDLGWLPALWASVEDAVLVDNVTHARRVFGCFRKRLGRGVCQFVERGQLPALDISQVEPWGWDAALANDLRRWGVSEGAMPHDNMLAQYRQLSHRRTSARLLPLLRMEGTVGEAVECATLQEVDDSIRRWGRVVMKAPWSSSGRGVCFSMQQGWAENVIRRQGSVMVEPYYNKVKDFGMEFEADGNGGIRYLGLSLFHTRNGAYTGNVLATERTKSTMISRYVPLALLEGIKERIISSACLDDYCGPFGVDMMVVNGDGRCKTDDGKWLLHPCVEVNLRRTMGHVTLGLLPTDDDVLRVMRIDYNGSNYKLKIQQLL